MVRIVERKVRSKVVMLFGLLLCVTSFLSSSAGGADAFQLFKSRKAKLTRKRADEFRDDMDFEEYQHETQTNQAAQGTRETSPTQQDTVAIPLAMIQGGNLPEQGTGQPLQLSQTSRERLQFGVSPAESGSQYSFDGEISPAVRSGSRGQGHAHSAGEIGKRRNARQLYGNGLTLTGQPGVSKSQGSGSSRLKSRRVASSSKNSQQGSPFGLDNRRNGKSRNRKQGVPPKDHTFSQALKVLLTQQQQHSVTTDVHQQTLAEQSIREQLSAEERLQLAELRRQNEIEQNLKQEMATQFVSQQLLMLNLLVSQANALTHAIQLNQEEIRRNVQKAAVQDQQSNSYQYANQERSSLSSESGASSTQGDVDAVDVQQQYMAQIAFLLEEINSKQQKIFSAAEQLHNMYFVQEIPAPLVAILQLTGARNLQELLDFCIQEGWQNLSISTAEHEMSSEATLQKLKTEIEIFFRDLRLGSEFYVEPSQATGGQAALRIMAYKLGTGMSLHNYSDSVINRPHGASAPYQEQAYQLLLPYTQSNTPGIEESETEESDYDDEHETRSVASVPVSHSQSYSHSDHGTDIASASGIGIGSVTIQQLEEEMTANQIALKKWLQKQRSENARVYHWQTIPAYIMKEEQQLFQQLQERQRQLLLEQERAPATAFNMGDLNSMLMAIINEEEERVNVKE